MGNQPTSDEDDYPGPSFAQSQRRTIIQQPYKSELEKQLHQTPLEEWRENETTEDKMKRRREIYPKKNVLTVDDITNWETAGWNIPAVQPFFPPNAQINSKVALLRGDIFSLEIDAVTNAANNTFLGGGGIDGAFHSQAGPLLIRDTAAANGLRTGRAKITKGYNLPARYIIHTAGPTETNVRELTSSYNTVLDCAVKHQLTSIALCCISTGIFGFPLMKATEIALRTVREYLEKRPDLNLKIIFVMFLAKEESAYHQLMPMYFPLSHNDNRVPEDPLAAEKRLQQEKSKLVEKKTADQTPPTEVVNEKGEDQEKEAADREPPVLPEESLAADLDQVNT